MPQEPHYGHAGALSIGARPADAPPSSELQGATSRLNHLVDRTREITGSVDALYGRLHGADGKGETVDKAAVIKQAGAVYELRHSLDVLEGVVNSLDESIMRLVNSNLA